MTRKGVQKALSDNGNPELSSINAIVKALGFRLAVKRLDASTAM